MAEAVGNSFLIVVLPLFIASDFVGGGSFGLAEVTITGIVLALFGFVNSPLQPITGRLSDRTGRRKVFLLAGLGLLSVSSLGYAMASTYWHLLALRVLQGVAGALIVPTSIALVNDFATDDDRGGNMGIYNAFRLVGFGVGPIGAGAVLAAGPYSLAFGEVGVNFTGFEAAFSFAAVTAVIGASLVLLFVCDPAIDSAGSEPEAAADGFVVFDRTGGNLFDPVFALGAVSFLMAVGIAMFATLGDVINARLEQGARMFGLQFAAFVFAHIVLQVPIGRATDFYGRKLFLVAGAVLLIPTTAVQGFILDSWVMFGARFAQGAAGAMVFTPALALAGDLAPEDGSGSTLSVLTMAFGLGIAVGPLLSGVLVRFGFPVPFVVGAALASIGVVLVATQVEDVVSPQRRPF
ncbi:MFS transporter [Natronobacterium haloterrestre]